MKELLLIRHAKSDWGDPVRADFDRPLNGRGKRDAQFMGSWLDRQGLYPVHFIASPAKRARMTAKAIAEAIGFPGDKIEWHDALYLANTNTLLARIRRMDPGIKRLALVGHNPGLTELANRLAAPLGTGIDNLPTCGIARFELDIQAWSEAGPESVVKAAFDDPKQHNAKA